MQSYKKYFHVNLSPKATRVRTKVHKSVMALAQPAQSREKKSFWSQAGQSFNSAGIVLFGRIALSDQSLAIPHLDVKDVSCIDWKVLKEAGFEGVIFDKDNTLTNPYELELHPAAVKALVSCREYFKDAIVLYSNSAGLEQYDPSGSEASSLEGALGIPVLRHREKKPAGGCSEVEEYFRLPSEKLIMVGDRYLTDIVFGNRAGMLTIRSAPFATTGEPLAVGLARRIEEACVTRWRRKGVVAPDQKLFAASQQAASDFLLSLSEHANP